MARLNFVKISEPKGSDLYQFSHKIISLYIPKYKDAISTNQDCNYRQQLRALTVVSGKT